MTRLLVRATNWVGDAVMSVPALQALRAAHPRAHIAILAMAWVADLYRDEPLCDEVIVYPGRRGWGDAMLKWRLAEELQTRRFDLAILLPNSFESAITPWLARIPMRTGYACDGRSMLLTHAVAAPGPGEIPRHQAYWYLELLRRAGVVDRPLPAELTIRLERAPLARQQGAALLRARGFDPRRTIGVSPGAAYGNAKRWLPERFAESAARLGGDVILFGSSGERALCGTVEGRLRALGIRAHNAAGETSLGEFAAMVAACRVLLTNDSGAMHVASALGVPTVTIFGATDPMATGPTGPVARIVREPVECSPCFKRECPIDHRCMTRVTVDRVVSTAQEFFP